MKVLITGSFGYIGGRLVEAFDALDSYEVVVRRKAVCQPLEHTHE